VSWTNAAGIWSHAGTDLQFVAPLRPSDADTTFTMPASFVAVAPMYSTAHVVGVRFLSAPDMRSGWRAGVDPDDTTKFTVRRRISGTLEAAGVGKSVAHGLSAGVPFTVIVRVENDVITASIVGTAAVITFTNSTELTFNQYNTLGLESAINGAKCGPVRLDDLNASVKVSNGIRNIWSAGDLYATLDGTTPTLLGSRVFPSNVPVSCAFLDGKGYALCGGKAVKIDYIARTIVAYTPNSGTLPGQGSAPGSTTGTLIASHLTRIGIASGTNCYFAAAGDPLDFNVASRQAYRAYTVALDEPIVAMRSTQFEKFVIGTVNGLAVVVGDPVLNDVQRVTLGRDGGPTGPNSMEITAEGVLYVHTKNGIMKGTIGGGMVPFSPPRLHQYLAIDDPTQWDITLIREPRFRLLYCFLRCKTSAFPSVGVVYDEVADRWLIDEYVAGHNPIACVLDNMEVLQGDTSGRIWSFDPSRYDDGGVQIPNVRCPLSAVDLAGDAGAVRITDFNLRLSRGSDPVTIKVYGGSSLNTAYDRTYRRELAVDSVAYGDPRKGMRAADRSMVAEITMPSTSRKFGIEEASVNTEAWRYAPYGDSVVVQAGAILTPGSRMPSGAGHEVGPGTGGGVTTGTTTPGGTSPPALPDLTSERPSTGDISGGVEPEPATEYVEPATPYGDVVEEEHLSTTAGPSVGVPSQPVDPL